MTDRGKAVGLVAVLTVAAGVAVGTVGLADADTFDVRLIAQTSSTVTLGWDAQTGDGYRFYRDGTAVSRTFDPARTSVKMSKGTSYQVEVLVISGGKKGTYPPATPPPPPPTSVAQVAVSTAGNDSTCVRGTLSKPCLTFAKAVAIAQAGDTVEVASGSYASQQVAGSYKQVTVRRAAGAIVSMPNLSAQCGSGLNLDGINAITLSVAGADNLTVRNGRYGNGSYTTNNEKDPVTVGPATSCPQGNKVAETVLLDTLEIGPYRFPNGDPGTAHPDCLQFFGGSDGVTIRNSSFHDCEDSFIGAFPDFGDIRNVTIENNTFLRLGDRTYYSSQWGCSGHPGTTSGIVIRGNTWSPDNPNALGPYSPVRTDCPGITVTGNTFNGDGPGQFSCDYWLATWGGTRWYDNTFNRDGACSS